MGVLKKGIFSCLAVSVEHVTLHFGVVNLSPTLSIEIA